MLDIPREASQIDNCAICNEKAERYILKNNLYVCHVCSSLDTLRPPCKIPNVLSPKASIPFSVAFRTFSLALKKGEWDVFSIWKFFLEQKSGSRPQKVFTPKKQPKNKTVRKLLLRGRYGSGKNALFSSDLAPVMLYPYMITKNKE
ncbi:hypothetical protein P9112_006288 [Eukaryota sp. TZLM1-RC]